MKRKYYCLLLLIGLFAGCYNPGEWRDDGIDASVRNEIDTLNNKLIDGLRRKDIHAVRQLYSDTLLVVSAPYLPKEIKTTASFIHGPFRIKNQFHVRLPKRGMVTLKSDAQDYEAYTIQFQSIMREVVVTLGYFKDSLIEYSLITVYGKYGNDWKLNQYRISPYRALSRDAMSWYQQAESEYTGGDDIDAYNHLLLAMNVLDTGSLLQYSKMKDALALRQDLAEHVRLTYHFPMIDEDVATRPLIFFIGQYIDGGVSYPLIAYKTELPLKDSAAITKEGKRIQHRLINKFRGVDRNEFIYYYVYGSMPDSLGQPHLTFKRRFLYGAEAE